MTVTVEMPVEPAEQCSCDRHRVRVWFGPYAITDFTGTAEYAERYQHMMEHRFPSLRVTNKLIHETEHEHG